MLLRSRYWRGDAHKLIEAARIVGIRRRSGARSAIEPYSTGQVAVIVIVVGRLIPHWVNDLLQKVIGEIEVGRILLLRPADGVLLAGHIAGRSEHYLAVIISWIGNRGIRIVNIHLLHQRHVPCLAAHAAAEGRG